MKKYLLTTDIQILSCLGRGAIDSTLSSPPCGKSVLYLFTYLLQYS